MKGALNKAPNILSQNPISDPQQHEMLAEHDMNNNPESSSTEIRLAAINGQESIRIQQLREHAEHDHEYQLPLNTILQGFLTTATSYQKSVDNIGTQETSSLSMMA